VVLVFGLFFQIYDGIVVLTVSTMLNSLKEYGCENILLSALIHDLLVL
jgi:hypothetical protein